MEIECTFSNGGSEYSCSVQSPPITKRGIKVTSCQGWHKAGKSNADVEAIHLLGVPVVYFPIGLGELFPNLKYLQMYHINNGLIEISRRDLIGLERLTTLKFYENRLRSLPDNLLSGMTKLTTVCFGGNKLEFVSSKLLEPIKNNKLIEVSFHGNPTKIGFYKPGATGSLGSLQELGDVIDRNFKKPVRWRQDLVSEDVPVGIVKGFKEFWTSGCFSDFVIVCESKEFKVHKIILANQSSVMAAAFRNDMQENKTGRMEIKNFSKEAVEESLQFMYTGETPEETNAMEILELASMYDVKELEYLMGQIIEQNIDESNVIKILTFAKQHNYEVLVQAAYNEIQKMFPETKEASCSGLPLVYPEKDCWFCADGGV